jgi:hypothetical protein
MGYVERSLGPGEQVAARGHLHWLTFGYGAGVTAIGMGAVLSGDSHMALPGGLVIAVGLYYVLRAYIDHISTELAVTNRRVIAKYGFFRHHAVNLAHADVEGFCVNQGLLGRVLNFGTVIVTDPQMQTQIHRIRDPLRFRALAMQQIEATQNHRP